jgi:hypothetical protein
VQQQAEGAGGGVAAGGAIDGGVGFPGFAVVLGLALLWQMMVEELVLALWAGGWRGATEGGDDGGAYGG